MLLKLVSAISYSQMAMSGPAEKFILSLDYTDQPDAASISSIMRRACCPGKYMVNNED